MFERFYRLLCGADFLPNPDLSPAEWMTLFEQAPLDLRLSRFRVSEKLTRKNCAEVHIPNDTMRALKRPGRPGESMLASELYFHFGESDPWFEVRPRLPAVHMLLGSPLLFVGPAIIIQFLDVSFDVKTGLLMMAAGWVGLPLVFIILTRLIAMGKLRKAIHDLRGYLGSNSIH